MNSPAGARVQLGRVTQLVPETGGWVLDDGTQARVLPALPSTADFPLQPGDFVSVLFAEDAVTVRAVELLARPLGDPSAFPPISSDWYRLQGDHRRRLRLLAQRARLLGEVRRFFSARDFLEIEAPLLVPSPGLELHLAAFSTQPDVAGQTRFLITSPEYQLKRLLAGGLQRIYSLGKVFRHGEIGPHHNPEFTMLEWYRAFQDWSSVATDVAELVEALAIALHGEPRFSYRGQLLDVKTPWPRMTVADAMQRYARVELRGDEDASELETKLRRAGHRRIQPGEGGAVPRWDDLFFSVFLDHVEPRLAELRSDDGQALRPVVLHDWPQPLCSLARAKPGNPAVVERFEAYIAGLELCNGFGELCDPVEQRRRFEQDAAERARRGLPVYPIDERFLSALVDGMPPSGGVALGVDRVAMLLLDARHIRDVLAFSADEL